MCTAYRAMCKRTVAPQAWAVCSVFVFVPYISRGSREVYALTTHRAFSSCRTMFCSIQSEQVSYMNMGTVQLKLNVDHTGSFVLRCRLHLRRRCCRRHLSCRHLNLSPSPSPTP